MNHRHLGSLVLASALLAASGCGSSSSSPKLTTNQLAAKAIPICVHLSAVMPALFKINDFKRIPAAASKAAAELRQGSSELDSLQPPASIADDWNAIVAGYRTLASDVSELGEHAKTTTKPDVPALAQLSQTEQAVSTTAHKTGITACSG
jgi:hypothetical protein